MMLSDPETGSPLAIMDATFLAMMRGGAVSAVATKYLARCEVKDVTVFGAGQQARTQLMGVCAVRDVNGAVVVDPDSLGPPVVCSHCMSTVSAGRNFCTNCGTKVEEGLAGAPGPEAPSYENLCPKCSFEVAAFDQGVDGFVRNASEEDGVQPGLFQGRAEVSATVGVTPATRLG